MNIPFTVYDYTGTANTASYTLPITPLTFIPNPLSASISNIRVYWDFGDNTFAETLTANHVYTIPGSYNVTLYLYDSGGECFVNTYTQTVNITDFVADGFTITPNNNPILTGHADYPFYINSYNSWQTFSVLSATGYTFNLYASGGHAPLINLDTYNADKFAHLKPNAKFVIESYNSITNIYDLIPVNYVTTTYSKLYAAIVNKQLMLVPPNNPNAVFAGTIGFAVVYFINDFPDVDQITTEYKPYTIFVSQDLSQFKDKDNYPIYNALSKSPYSILNKLPENFTYNTDIPHSAYHLQFSSNGADGDGLETNMFYLNPNKFQGTNIPFVVRLKDINNYPAKYESVLTLINTNAALTNNTIHIIVCNDSGPLPIQVVPAFGSLSAEQYGGYFRGYINPQITANNVYLSAVAYVGSQAISGISSTFNIYPSAGKYNIAKANENVDFKEMYKSYRFQEGLLDKSIFFDNYLGTIVGDIDSNPNTLGKRIYEKIANFVDNTYNIDTCNINSLKSQFDLVGANTTTFDQSNFAFPSNIGRIIDLLSIKHSKLWGAHNKFAENFDNKGYLASNIYGINRGAELDISTSTISIDTDQFIVAYEKFSGIYTLCNTNVLSSEYIQINNNTYPLSTYTDQWGWGLVLPSTYIGADLVNYYKFFKYIPTAENTLLEGVINWNDSLTTLSETQSSYSDWVQQDGIMDTIVAHSLYDGFELFRSIPFISAPTLYWKNISGDRAWENVVNWFVDINATIQALNAPWVDNVDVNYLTYNLTTAAGETSKPIMSVSRTPISFGANATGSADFVGSKPGGPPASSWFTTYGTINGGTYTGDYILIRGRVNAGKFTGNWIRFGYDASNFAYIYGGLFTGDDNVNNSTIYGGYFTGNNMENNAYIYNGVFSGDNFTNKVVIYGGTFTGRNNVNYGTVPAGTELEWN